MDFSVRGTLTKVSYKPVKNAAPVCQIVLEVDVDRELGTLGMFVGQSVEAVISSAQMPLPGMLRKIGGDHE